MGYVKALSSIYSSVRKYAVLKISQIAQNFRGKTSKAFQAIVEYGNVHSAKEPLLDLLADSYLDVIKAAEAAAEVLSVSDEEKVGAYRKALDSIHSVTREHAKGALRRLGVATEDGRGRKPSGSSPIDSEMLGNGNIPGGIDFNANNLNLKKQGQIPDFNFTNSMNIQPHTVNGITPVIINITPIVNFPLLLGGYEGGDRNT